MAKMGYSPNAEDPLADHNEQELVAKQQQLTKELNLDEETASEAMKSLRTICTNYTLEGDQLHWLGCAIFVSCRKTVTRTLSHDFLRGNPISLTSLLRNCNLSATQFFHKLEAWIEMAKLNDDVEFKRKVEKLKNGFTITCTVFKDFYPIFERIFRPPDMSAIRHRNRKQRSTTCTPTKVFEFTWLLFITIKAKNPLTSVVQAFQFLLACFDLIFKNALLGNHRELLNPSFEGLPLNWSLPGYQPTEAPCIMSQLLSLSQHMDMLSSAVYEKEYTVKRLVQNMINDGILKGNANNLTEMLDQGNFEHNYLNIGKAYDQLILNEGNIDERIFLAECQRQFILQNSIVANGNSGNRQQNETEECGEETPRVNSSGEGNQCPPTPLSVIKLLRPRDQNESALSASSQSIARLKTILAGCTKEPSDKLMEIFRNCDEDPLPKIKSILNEMNSKFLDKFQEQNENVRPENKNDGEKKLQISVTLFYKVLENMLLAEKNNSKFSTLLAKDIFYKSLYTCCLVIILYTHKCQRKFPWILEALEIPALDLVRVIELLVRSKDQFSRDTIKHLGFVEESILESIMWKSDSILWENLKVWGDIPKFEEVSPPSSMGEGKRILPQSTGQSPGPSAVETFQSPVNVQVKKQLFPVVKPGQSLLQNNRSLTATHLMVTDHEGNRKLIPLEQSTTIIPQQSPTPEKPKKVGSHCIIYRKFYCLAGLRLDHLCNKLNIADIDLKRKIWTVFEHSIRVNTDLIRDRHLDQLLMCAVYVICKITGNVEKNFSEIMKCYRVQPQANSDIYRNVLITRAKQDENGEIEPETHKSLIDFYNNIYVQAMKNFVAQFSNSQNQELMLSPLPSVRSVSPKHQIMKNVFIRPYESPNNSSKDNVNNTSYSYLFSRSASKELNNINRAINGNGISGKHLLSDNFDGDLPNKKIAKKMQALIEERKVQSME